MNHSELCILTAKWALTPPKADWLALYEYKSYASVEEPDVLTYSASGTRLYEIKTSHSDFIADQKKEARIKRQSGRVYSYLMKEIEEAESMARRRKDPVYIPPPFKKRLVNLTARINCIIDQEKSFQQAPHLGQERFYVCEPGIISKEEVPSGWGLIYFEENKKFRMIVSSGKWKADVRTERDIIAHAMRRYASGDNTGIIVRTYNSGSIKDGV
jgi:16S rRNA G966 N2-methylase RsmD